MNKGFTMAELLTVVVIIAVLSSIALPQYTKSVERARATEAMSLVKNINDAIYSYAAARTGNNACPDSFHKLIVTLPVRNDKTAVLETPNFTYSLLSTTSEFIPGTPCHGVTATRRNGGVNYDYVIWNPFEITTTDAKAASMRCTSPSGNKASIEICQSLGIYKANN